MVDNSTVPTNNDEENQEYHDWSDENDDSSNAPTSHKSNFPVRLHCLITEAAKDGLESVISWHPHGRSFGIHKPKVFVETLLPLWFNQTKLRSFNRQLNIYGFTRILSGKDKGGYYHECFLRGMVFLSHRIPRQERKPKRTVSLTPPNFYKMKFLPDSIPDNTRTEEQAALSSSPSATSQVSTSTEQVQQVPVVDGSQDPSILQESRVVPDEVHNQVAVMAQNNSSLLNVRDGIVNEGVQAQVLDTRLLMQHRLQQLGLEVLLTLQRNAP